MARNYRRQLLLAFLVFVLASCTAKPAWLSLVQDGREKGLPSSGIVNVELEKRSFSLRGTVHAYDESAGRFYGIKAIATDNSSIFDKIRVGARTDGEGYFGPGTGMAIDPSSSSLFIDEGGFNFLYYLKGADDQSPMKLVGPKGDGFDVSCTFIGLSQDGYAGSIEQWRGKELCIVFYYDANLNDTIDAGELVKARIRFKAGR